MKSDIPPNLFRIVDAIGRDKQLQVIFVFAEAFERIRNARARKTLEDHLAIRFEASVLAQPKRRIDGERVNVRKEIARLIHDVDRFFAIGNSDVDVQAENEIHACDLLHVLHDSRVALVGGYQLLHPV